MRLSSGTVRRRRLLVVDPDAVYRTGLEEPLEAALWSVLGWARAEEALAWLQANPGQDVDAIWCERVLRDGTGDELIARVHALRPALPALIVTSSQDVTAHQVGSIRVFPKKETGAAVRWLATLEPENGAASSFVPFR